MKPSQPSTLLWIFITIQILLKSTIAFHVGTNGCSNTRSPHGQHLEKLRSSWHLASTSDDNIVIHDSLVSHHTAIKTRNITVAIQFFSLFGYQIEAKFRAGPARAAWLSLRHGGGRLELIEVPSYVLQEPEGMKKRAFDLMARPELLGWNHLALDVSSAVQARGSKDYQLGNWLQDLNETSIARVGKSLRIALEPRQQIIGGNVYELAFLYDADGALLELLNRQSNLEQDIDSGWEPLDGQGFEFT